MRTKSTRLLPILFFVFVSNALINSVQAGQIYKTVDENGNVVFTDQPQKGAEEIKLKPLPVVPSIPVNNTANTTSTTNNSLPTNDFQYRQIDIVFPDADEDSLIRSNNGKFTVIANLSPRLISTHRLQLLIDGNLQGSPRASNVFSLNNINRGEHQVQIEVLDASGAVIQRSPTKQVSIQRTSTNQPGRRR